MDNHAEDRNSGKTHALSALDWPTPEQLAAAHRLRGQALRDMTVALCRRLLAHVPRHAAQAGRGMAARKL